VGSASSKSTATFPPRALMDEISEPEDEST
jgi:hypothetical protein